MNVLEKGGESDINTEERFEQLLHQYEKLVYTICLRTTKNEFDAQDLTQDTFLSVYRNLEQFDGTYERAWICRIATNKCLDYLKSAKRTEEPLEDTMLETAMDTRDGPEQQYLEKEAREQVLRLCRALSPPYDEIAEAHFYEEKSAREIAEETGRNLKTVQTQIYRAKAMIRKLMKGLIVK
ncbi:MAG: RNA polymerase sigma factor [Lachnospiraceae bacterium]